MNRVKIYSAVVFTLSLFMLCRFEGQAEAGIFSPSNYAECVKEYVPKTQSNQAAKYIGWACRDLLIKDYKEGELKPVDQITQEELHAELDQQNALAQMSVAELQALLDTADKEKKNKQNDNNKKRKRAQCILDLDELYEAKNDQAAKLIYFNSGCNK